MFNHVLVPLDGSIAAEAAVAYAMLLPSRVVTLLMVIPTVDTPGYDWLTDVADDTHHDEQGKRALTYLESVAAPRRDRNRTLKPVVAEGDPSERIIEAAKDASLILMTNHGHGTTSPTAYGRTVDRIARHSGKPVLVVRGLEQPGTLPVLDRIVVPLDGSDVAEEAAPLAMELSSQTGAPLHLVSVVDPALVPAGRTEVASDHANAYLASEQERLRSHAVEVTKEVRLGAPAAELIAAIKPGDLIVLSAFGAGSGKRWLLGGVADKLIRSASAPVLVIRPSKSGPA